MIALPARGPSPLPPDGSAKTAQVDAIFRSVARRYDVMNDIMSAGVHRWWKSALVDWLAPQPGARYLDVAGGTGDIAFRIARRLRRRDTGAPILVCDANDAMLAIGRARAERFGLSPLVGWLCGDAEKLPLADRSVDAYTIAFGIRNVADAAAALREALRVLKRGGRFLCLEFSTVEIPGLDRLYDAYSRHLLPRIGGLVTGDRDAYEYLVDSIRRFPDQERFKTMIEAAGFARVKVRNLSGGIVALHSAWRL